MPILADNDRASLLKEIQQSRVIVVGAGMFGLTIAEQVATKLNLKVLVLDVRDHIGGNAYSYFDEETGIEIHKYGSHLFHTSNEKVWEYINKFSTFNNYKHRVFANYNGNIYSMPINLHTISQFYGRSLSPIEARQLIDLEVTKTSREEKSSFKSEAYSKIGKQLYDAFFHGYTLKQWETDPAYLPASIFSRLPVRFNFDSNYFGDKYQGLPNNGYSALFQNMISNKNISVSLKTDFFDYKDFIESMSKLIVYTGPIDRFFNNSQGMLGWRTLDFELETHDIDDFQGTSVVNYVDLARPFTRIHEFKHMYPERKHLENKTVVMKEFSRLAKPKDEPYYPINAESDRKIIKEYRKMTESIGNQVLFGGRLGSYQYLDMHMAIGSALVMFENEIARMKL